MHFDRVVEAKPERPQFQYPEFVVGEFARWQATKIKVCAMRWDFLNHEFQYLIRSRVSPGAEKAWVSERTIDRA